MVPGVAVEEAEQVAARRGVNDLVYLRQPERVLRAVLVEVGVVEAHPPLVRVLLADEDGVVNTKNWNRKGSDLWAEFGNKMPFGRKIS
jgi:hypothetical protein